MTINFETAYLHRSEGKPGADQGTGWTQAGSLEFASANLLGTPEIGESWIVAGSLRVDEAEELHLIPVPFNVVGNIEATFTFNNGCVLHLQASPHSSPD